MQLEENILTFPVNAFAISNFTTLGVPQSEDDEDDFDILDFPTQPEVAAEPVKPQVTSDSTPFYDDLCLLATKYIKQFFLGKSAYYGGPVDRRIVIRQHYIDLVLNTTIEEGVKSIYDHWHHSKTVSLRDIRVAKKTGDIPSDIESVIAVLHECADIGVPKCFAGGIAMMYFEFCEGFEFAPDALTYSNVG